MNTIPLSDLRAYLVEELCLPAAVPLVLVRVPGASACETEEAAIRLWAGWFLEQMPGEVPC